MYQELSYLVKSQTPPRKHLELNEKSHRRMITFHVSEEAHTSGVQSNSARRFIQMKRDKLLEF